ncbi:mannitol 1-phosphate dehydrogenase [Seiridium cupressi]
MSHDNDSKHLLRQNHHSVVSPQLPQLFPGDDMSEANSAIRVAIIGGGLAGTALLRGLLRYPHIAVDMYEARLSFKDERPGIELNVLAQGVLRAIDPSIDTCLIRAGAVCTSSEFRISAGPFAGQRINVNDPSSDGKLTVGRQALLTELLGGVPPRMVHFNTRVTSIMEASPGNGLVLTFSDGSQKRYDVVIGADGVHGKTRAHVIGPNDPAQNPRPSGLWSLPIKVPFERAVEAMGPETLDPRHPQQVTWIGDGTTMQQDLLDMGRGVQITTSATFDGTNEDFSWAKLFTPDEFTQIFSRNMLQPCQGIIKIAGICQMQFVPTRTYSSRNAALVCDAAHGMFSFHGASLSLALEEVLILLNLLGRSTSRSAVPSALRAYDEMCRPRAELFIRANADIGLLMAGRAPGIGLDPVLLAKTLKQKWNVVNSLDINAYCMAAIAAMDGSQPIHMQW